jgi:DivIVA domain-containing protein
MDVSPKTLREVEFREKLRGYHPEDVDQFLEQVAVGLEGMQDRLRQAVERAQRAESAAAAAPPSQAVPSGDSTASEETLRKTLVLAQRTADLAVQEAREQAARILSSAEQQAQLRLADAEERARRTHEDALSDVRAELTSLEVTRQRAQQEVDALNRWVEDHRAELTGTLSEALSLVERVGVRSPAPTTRPIDVPPPPRPTGPMGAPQPGGVPSGGGGPGAGGLPPGGPGPVPAGPLPRGPGPASQGPGPGPPSPGGPPGPMTAATSLPPRPAPSTVRPAPPPPAPPPPPGPPAADLSGGRPATPTFKMPPREAPDVEGPPTVAWQPPGGVGAHSRSADEIDPTPGQGTPVVDDRGRGEPDPEDQALDDFFEDEDASGYLSERRFGGRLRRRR